MSVIKTSTAAAVVISAFHKDVAAIALTGMRAGQTMAKKMEALLTSRYGATAPTFEEYRADLKALAQVAKDRKLESDQWVRRPYCAAVKALFKELPVSMAPDAVAKRLQRETALAQVKAALKAAGTAPAAVGAPAGETQERAPSEAEQLEQLVTRVGVFETLYACLRILGADASTEAQAVHMRKQADKAKAEYAKAEAAARAKAITPATV